MWHKNLICLVFCVGVFFAHGEPVESMRRKYSSNWPQETLAKLNLRQKIGQLLMVAAASNFSQANESLASAMQRSPYDMTSSHVEQMIREYGIGGVFFLYKSDPVTQSHLMQKFQNLSQVPLLFAQDSEWGLSMRLDLDPDQVVRYPHNLTLGAIKNSKLIYEIGYEIGRECAAIGIHMNFAPVADINNNSENPVIHDRSFGDDPAEVAHRSLLFMQGLQAGGVLACGKHFPGHGDTSTDSHFSLPLIKHGRAHFDQVELVPFRALIQSGVNSMMLAHLAAPGLDDSGVATSLSPKIVTDLLQDELGFTGLKITDGLGMGAVMLRYAPGELELQAFLAGNDLMLGSLNVAKAIDLIENAIKSGQVSEQELDRRVLKVLQAKAQIFARQAKIGRKVLDFTKFLVRPAAQNLAKKAYRAAITQVKQDSKIKFNKQNFAQSLIMQIGDLQVDQFSESCAKLKKQVLKYSAKFDANALQESLLAAQNYSRVIISISEITKSAATNFGISNHALELVQILKKQNKQVVIVLFGTPYSIKLFLDANAILVAYEDVPFAQEAIVDVLCGKLKPAGALPVKI